VPNQLLKGAQAWRAPRVQVGDARKTWPTPRRPGSAKPPGTWT